VKQIVDLLDAFHCFKYTYIVVKYAQHNL